MFHALTVFAALVEVVGHCRTGSRWQKATDLAMASMAQEDLCSGLLDDDYFVT